MIVNFWCSRWRVLPSGQLHPAALRRCVRVALRHHCASLLWHVRHGVSRGVFTHFGGSDPERRATRSFSKQTGEGLIARVRTRVGSEEELRVDEEHVNAWITCSSSWNGLL